MKLEIIDFSNLRLDKLFWLVVLMFGFYYSLVQSLLVQWGSSSLKMCNRYGSHLQKKEKNLEQCMPLGDVVPFATDELASFLIDSL